MGAYWGYISTAMPFALRKQGVPIDSIATISAAAGVAQVVCFLWAPVIDMGLSRRAWYFVVNLASAIFLAIALLLPVHRFLVLYGVLLTLGNAVSSSAAPAAGGLMAVLMPNSVRGRTGGWYQAGALGGGALAGGASIWLDQYFSPIVVAVGTAAMVALPAFVVLALREPLRMCAFSARLLQSNLRELWALRSQRAIWLGLAFFLAPVGAGAAGNLFSGLADEFHASAATVIWTTGFGCALFTAAGCIGGGYLCDRIDRWKAYLLCGVPGAAAAGAMMMLPRSTAVFTSGALIYVVGTGLSFAAWNALALELVGDSPSTAGTRFSLFGCASNAPVAYMTWLDGQGARFWGVNGLLGVDMLGAVLGIVGLALLLRCQVSRATPVAQAAD
jgi:MFS transporter, PAT family, beta-lactamase induction signal transducer AmpG